MPGLLKRSTNTGSEPVYVDLLRRPGIDSQPGGPVRNLICRTELVFVDLLWSPRIDSQAGVPVRQPYLSYRPDKLHRLAKSIPGLHKRLQIRALARQAT
jgi:hypothetical protein